MGKIRLGSIGDEIIYVTTGGDAGQGSFLDPPNYPTHKFGISSRFRSQDIVSFSKEEPQFKEQLKPYLKFDKLPENHPEVQKWIKQHYSYFKNSYSKNGINRNVNDAIINEKDELPNNHHLAFLAVRKFYPNHKPRKDLIKSKAWVWGNPKAEYKKIVKPIKVTEHKRNGSRVSSHRRTKPRRNKTR